MSCHVSTAIEANTMTPPQMGGAKPLAINVPSCIVMRLSERGKITWVGDDGSLSAGESAIGTAAAFALSGTLLGFTVTYLCLAAQ